MKTGFTYRNSIGRFVTVEQYQDAQRERRLHAMLGTRYATSRMLCRIAASRMIEADEIGALAWDAAFTILYP